MVRLSNGQILTLEAYKELRSLSPALNTLGIEHVHYRAVQEEPIIDIIDVMVNGVEVLNVAKSSHDTKY